MKVLYFAWVREKTGTADEEFALPGGVGDIDTLVEYLKARGGGFADAFADMGHVRTALNMEYVDGAAKINDGDEVAFFPPVTGG